VTVVTLCLMDPALFAVDVAEITVPSQRNDIHYHNTMFQRYECEIAELYKWPDHPVFLQRHDVSLFQLFFRAGTLHHSHCAKENEKVGRCK
jgi:hypothetical protein